MSTMREKSTAPRKKTFPMMRADEMREGRLADRLRRCGRSRLDPRYRAPTFRLHARINTTTGINRRYERAIEDRLRCMPLQRWQIGSEELVAGSLHTRRPLTMTLQVSPRYFHPSRDPFPPLLHLCRYLANHV